MWNVSVRRHGRRLVKSPRSAHPSSAVAALLIAAAGGLLAPSAHADDTKDGSTSPNAPNLWGQTGLVRTTSARVHGNLVFDVSGAAFGTASWDSVVPAVADFSATAGGQLALSAAFLDVIELSLATRSASTSNVGRGPAQYVLGDLLPSLKLGLALLPVALAVDVRAVLPSRVDRVGVDLANWGLMSQGLVTVDLKDRMDIPFRAHVNAGYSFQGGKYLHTAGGRFEDNPTFYNGIDGALLALTADAWFYDCVVAGVGVEAPLPFATPFLEAFYRTAIGVPADRGVGNQPYDPARDAHLTVTPGLRIAVAQGITLDASVDIGVLGTAGGGVDVKNIVPGTPLNPAWLGRLGITGTFEPFAPRPSGPPPVPPSPPQPPVDVAPVPPAETPQPAAPPAPGRLSGWVTNKDDEVVEAELELWDLTGVKSGGRAAGGLVDVAAPAGPVALVARAEGYLSQGISTVVEPGARVAANVVLKKVPKSRKAVLEKDRITHPARVPFEFKKARLQSTAEYMLDEIVDLLLANPALRLEVAVYAEALATPEEGQRLADERAHAVVDYLVGRGVWRGRLQARGTALAPTDSEKLRRVDFTILP